MAGTVVPGVKRAPGPSRVSRVRNMETPLGSAPVRCGRPIVRGAESPGGTGCPRSQCRRPKGDGKTSAVIPVPLPGRCITGRIPGLVPGRESALT